MLIKPKFIINNYRNSNDIKKILNHKLPNT